MCKDALQASETIIRTHVMRPNELVYIPSFSKV
jgi:hypothetical protein